MTVSEELRQAAEKLEADPRDEFDPLLAELFRDIAGDVDRNPRRDVPVVVLQIARRINQGEVVTR